MYLHDVQGERVTWKSPLGFIMAAQEIQGIDLVLTQEKGKTSRVFHSYSEPGLGVYLAALKILGDKAPAFDDLQVLGGRHAHDLGAFPDDGRCIDPIRLNKWQLPEKTTDSFTLEDLGDFVLGAYQSKVAYYGYEEDGCLAIHEIPEGFRGTKVNTKNDLRLTPDDMRFTLRAIHQFYGDQEYLRRVYDLIIPNS